MILQHIYETYGISCYFDRTSNGTWMRYQDWYMFPTPIAAFRESSLETLFLVSSHLNEKGDPAAQIMKTLNGDFMSTYQGESLVLLATPSSNRGKPLTGESLAHFHQITAFDHSIISAERPYLNWSTLWQTRADQTYSWVAESMNREEPTQFERVLKKVFPYFSGRAENAIQYIVDLMLDAYVDEGACLCYHRIRPKVWQEETNVKWPTEWVVDHPGRDVGEWFRACCSEFEEPEEACYQFLSSYNEVKGISNVGASVAYARLLFPLTFYEIVEGYESGQLNEHEALDQLDRYLNVSKREERLLSLFENLGLTPHAQVDWLRLPAST